MLGLYKKIRSKFARIYKDFFSEIKKIAAQFIEDIKTKKFPAKEESFFMQHKEWVKLNRKIKNRPSSS
jgi:ketopantoate hydroxymethyltransferase